jgi:hypothetical protein
MTRLPMSRIRPCAGETFVPDRDVSGWKPQATLPATSPTTPIVKTSAIVYVHVASTFPANTSPRSRERVRIVFRVPLWLSEATMSPATSAVTSGRPQIDMKKRTTNGTASPVSRM